MLYKQLQGLYAKASEVKDMPPGKLAGIEAIIKRMPTRDKSTLPETKPMFVKDEQIGILINSILVNYPQHKRVVFLKAKYENNEVLSALEIADLERLKKLLDKKK